MNLFLLLLSLICVAAAGLGYALITYMNDKVKAHPTQASNKKQKRESKLVYMYETLSQIPIFGRHLSDIRAKLFVSKNLDEYNLRIRAVTIAIATFGITFLSALVLLKIYGSSFQIQVIIILLCLWMNTVLVDSLVGNMDIEILKQIPDYLNDVKHHFHSTGMIDEAIYSASANAKQDISIQGRIVYDILVSSEKERKLQEYNSRCPNKYLKIFASFSYLTHEYGDTVVDGVSLYIKNLNFIIQEVQLEILKMDQLKYWLKSLPAIAIAPLLFPNLIEKFVAANFPDVKDFYSSNLGYFVENFIIILGISCFFLVQRLGKNFNTNLFKIRNSVPVEARILKVRWIMNLVDAIKPVPGTKKHQNLVYLIQHSGSSLQIDWLYLRKLVFATSALVAIISIFITGHYMNSETILNNAAYGITNDKFFMMVGQMKGKEVTEQKQVNDFDRMIIEQFPNPKKYGERLKDAIIQEIEKKGYQLENIQIAADRITNKIHAKEKERLKFWELLVSILTAGIVYNVPHWLLHFQIALRKADMEDEVFQFHTIILLLMNHSSADVEMIITWMEQFSDIFKNPIRKCRNNFESGAVKALEALKKEVNYIPLANIVDNLIMANEKINLKAAFDSLSTDREFYSDQRKEANIRSVENRKELGQIIGFAPFHAVVSLYLVIPLIISSMTQAVKILDMFK